MNIAISPAVAFYWNVIQLSYAEYSKSVSDLLLILNYQNQSQILTKGLRIYRLILPIKLKNVWNCVNYQCCTCISTFQDNICPQIVFQLAATLSFQLLMYSLVFLKTKLLGRQIFMTDFVPLFLESMLWHKVNKKYNYKRVYKKYQYITVGKNKYLSCVEYYSSRLIFVGRNILLKCLT